jgi:predicted ATPase
LASVLVRFFGPVKEGYNGDNGFLRIAPVTFFCGEQATGKSTVAKVYAIFSWLEKALERGDYETGFDSSDFLQLLKNQRIDAYHTSRTVLAYCGKAYNFTWKDKVFTIDKVVNDETAYSRPQIMYIPAERNLLTVLDDVEQRKNLPPMLSVLLDEYQKAKEKLATNGGYTLPVSMLTLKYQQDTNVTTIISNDHTSIRIGDASSGIQSVAPLSLVTEYLRRELKIPAVDRIQSLALKERNEIKAFITNKYGQQAKTLSNEFDRYFTSGSSKQISKENLSTLESILHHFFNSYLINIVEEPEQNLYPESQEKVLYQLLRTVNDNPLNELLITTHSPYLLSFLTNVAKAKELLDEGIPEEQVNKIIPSESAFSGKNISIYETMVDGTIQELPPFENLPSDENLLNTMLEKTNDTFAQLLDLEERYCNKG